MENSRFIHYKLNIEVIDKEHANLLRLLEEFKSEVYTSSIAYDKITYIYTLLNIHFANEEKFMYEINYPYLEYHKTAHKKISNNFFEIVKKDKDNMSFSKYLIATLENDILTHIDHFDFQIKDFLEKKNIKLSKNQ